MTWVRACVRACVERRYQVTIHPSFLKLPKAIYLVPSKDKIAVLQDLLFRSGEAKAAWKRESESDPHTVTCWGEVISRFLAYLSSLTQP